MAGNPARPQHIGACKPSDYPGIIRHHNKRANNMNETQYSAASAFQLAVLWLAIKHNASITSTYRTAKRNKTVGGHQKSKHMSGLAADLVLDTVNKSTVSKLEKDARALGWGFLQEGDHIHLQSSPPLKK